MPCVAELPQLEHLKRRERELGFHLLGLEVKGYLAAMQAVEKEKKITFPILLDDERYARNELQISGTPTTFIIDERGHIRARLVGGSSDMERVIAQVLVKI
jgi:peroxiredoxin